MLPRAGWVTLVIAAAALCVVPSFSLATASFGLPSACDVGDACAPRGLPAGVSPPVSGVVTHCATASSCDFVFNTSQGSGWANASPPAMTLRLPGEASTSLNLSYSTYTARLTGTYTYWTVGNFVGTDVNTKKVVYGITNTNFTITCHGHSGRGGGCTYTYTTDNGTILVNFTNADQTSSGVSCAPSTIGSGGSTICTATVDDLVNATAHPAGNVSFSGAYGGTTVFSNGGKCALISGACSVSYSAPDDQLGTVPITATFAGTPSFYPSGGRTSIYVGASGGGGGNYSNVHFSESGLPNGTLWNVTLGGLTLASTTPDLIFVVQNGTYPFAVGTQPGYLVSPRTGNVTVAGRGTGRSIQFSVVTFSVTMTAVGLPAGAQWGVLWDGRSSTSRGTSIVTNVPNGSYSYLVFGPAGYRVSGATPTGVVVVAGAPVARSFNFARGTTYAIVFTETGLPRGTSWCIDIAGVICASTATLRFLNLTPASYSYAVLPMVGQVISARLGLSSIPLAGSLALTNRSVLVALHYTYPYAVTFTETGLPSGTNWSITVRGIRLTSNGTTITFLEPNGTYYYRVWPVGGFLYSKVPLAVRVLGSAATAQVYFRP